MKKFNSKIAALIVLAILSTSFSPLFAQKARAQWIVEDPANLVQNIMTVVKQYGLDGIAWQLANIIIERIAASTVNWINSGFKGSPAFITDPGAYFQDLGDKVAGQYIFSNPNLKFLCGPISAKIKLALTNSYIQDRQWKCTLTQVGKNMDNFMSSFDNGGWNSFFEVSQRTQNNPIGAFMQAQDEMYLQLATTQGTKKEELAQGGGFQSFKRCKAGMEQKTCTERDASNNCTKYYTYCDPRDEETVTPGSVIQDQLNKVVGSGGNRLNVSTQINQIVGALLSQLANQVMGSVGGLLGSSNPPSTGGYSFTAQLASSSPTEPDALKRSPDTSILNTPIPDPYAGMPPGAKPVWPPAPTTDPVCDPTSPTYNPSDPVCNTP